jgi:hypothetical protein
MVIIIMNACLMLVIGILTSRDEDAVRLILLTAGTVVLTAMALFLYSSLDNRVLPENRFEVAYVSKNDTLFRIIRLQPTVIKLKNPSP